jgi:hypothetical protein
MAYYDVDDEELEPEVKKNRDFVYLYWKNPKESFKDNDSYAPDLWLLDLGSKHFCETDYAILWEKAAIYTMLRLKLIEEKESQLYWLLHDTESCAITSEQSIARHGIIVIIQKGLESLKELLKLI